MQQTSHFKLKKIRASAEVAMCTRERNFYKFKLSLGSHIIKVHKGMYRCSNVNNLNFKNKSFYTFMYILTITSMSFIKASEEKMRKICVSYHFNVRFFYFKDNSYNYMILVHWSIITIL